ncbi:hypothetical protein [Methyloglobulus sp.]|uniref:hypothetical protein n=1 Tax=Methyloglobulus sp. TaxID=2518622 RepID=UPI003988E5FA
MSTLIKQRHIDRAAVHHWNLELYFRSVHILNRAICKRCHLQQYGDAHQRDTLIIFICVSYLQAELPHISA